MSRPIRVLMAAPSQDILGGQSRQAARLLEQFGKEPGLDVSFIPHNPRLPGVLRGLQSVRYVRTVVTSLLYWAMLLARVWRYDIVHVFSASYYSYMLSAMPAILVAKLYRKKVVLNYRSGEAEDHLANWRRTAVPTIRLADRVVVPSGYLVDVFARFGLSATPIFNIVDKNRFRFRTRQPLRPVFLSNRNFEPHYNVGCVLRAFAIIQGRYPEARIIIAGDGSQRRGLEALARDLNLRGTQFLGQVRPEDIHELYNEADIYLNSSEVDNMPGSIIEAFASGLPVVTTDAGGIPYIVTHDKTGLMVPRGDYEAMAESAIRLLENEELAFHITGNAHAECSKFSWEAVRSEWLKLYREILPESNASRAEGAFRRVS